MSWYSDTPEDQAICLFAGLLANPDMSFIRSVPGLIILVRETCP
jgi:hypothetical protein